MGRSDQELAQAIRQGSHQSFKVLYDRYHKQLYYLAIQYLKDKNLAKDAVQDVFLKFWENRQHLNPTSSIEGFLFTMLKNHVLNIIRDENTRKRIINEMQKMVRDTTMESVVEEEIIYSEFKGIIKKVIQKVSPSKREVFRLRIFEGLSNTEVADKRGVSEHTVKTQYYLASKYVRNYLKEKIGLFTVTLVLFIEWVNALLGGYF